MEIVASQSGDFTRTGGKQVMESFLNSMDPAEICAVWAHNDDMLIGATQAMAEAGLDSGDDILFGITAPRARTPSDVGLVGGEIEHAVAGQRLRKRHACHVWITLMKKKHSHAIAHDFGFSQRTLRRNHRHSMSLARQTPGEWPQKSLI